MFFQQSFRSTDGNPMYGYIAILKYSCLVHIGLHIKFTRFIKGITRVRAFWTVLCVLGVP